MAHTFNLTLRSNNVKTGPIPVTMTSKDSCPTDCVFMGNGCYAESGPMSWLWSKLSSVAPGETFKNGTAELVAKSFDDLLKFVRKIPAGMLWRHNQAGDLPGVGLNIDPDMLAELVKANRGKRGWTYTHKPAMGKNLDAIRAANAAGFTVNVSANSAKHAAAIKSANPDLPVVCVLPIEAENERVIKEGEHKILVCPATRPGSDITCAACGLCQIAARNSIVGFPAHGARKNVAAKIAA